jgi:hypothetical protein
MDSGSWFAASGRTGFTATDCGQRYQYRFPTEYDIATVENIEVAGIGSTAA